MAKKLRRLGVRKLILVLGLRRYFPFSFVIADVSHAMVDADFLEKFGQILDIKRKRLLDSATSLESPMRAIQNSGRLVTPVTTDTPFFELILQLPDLFKSELIGNAEQHGVQHCIETRGPPVFSKDRKPAPIKLKAFRQEFDSLLKAGIIRPSSSQWSSPVDLMPSSPYTGHLTLLTRKHYFFQK